MFVFSRAKHINFAKLYGQAREAVMDLPPLKKRRRTKSILRFLKWFFIALICLVAIAGFYLAAHLLTFKMIYQRALTGKDNIAYAVALIKERDYESGIAFATAAEEDFSAAIEQLGKLSADPVLGRLNIAASQINDLGYLLSAAETLSRAAAKGASIGRAFDQVMAGQSSFNRLTPDNKTVVLSLLYESTPEIVGLKANFDLAKYNLDRVSYRGILLPFKGQISELLGNIDTVSETIDGLVPAVKLLPVLAGYPDPAAYLVLLQNSDELRPTGGFIGTYGIATTHEGDLLRFDTHDIYHLDMPVKDKLSIAPPEPLKKYLGIDKWYMRDANWSPDWPTAARTIQDFYRQENALLPPRDRVNDFDGDFDGVIGITPRFVVSLLAYTGPVMIEGVAYDKDNFMDLLQYRVEMGYEQLGVSSWQRKEVIGEILAEMERIILNKPLNELYPVYNIISDNLRERNIIAYFNDAELEAIAGEQNWSGAVTETDGDYLYVVDANVAALKTDAVMDRNLTYELDEGANGLFARLTLHYSHQGDFDWKTTRYRSYTRVYVPAGSELIEAKGFSEEMAEPYDELGKTVFGGFISIEPGKIGTIELYYKLPDAIEQAAGSGEYTLLLQKQPGMRDHPGTIKMNFARPIDSYTPTGFFGYLTGSNSISWEDELKIDQTYSVSF